MAKWIELDASTISDDERSEVSGVEIRVGLSPFDIPDGVRGYYDDQRQRFVIEFRYIGNHEEKVAGPKDGHITIMVGKTSGRLYEIHVDIDKVSSQGIKLTLLKPEVDKALDRLADQASEPKKRSYQVARAAFTENAQELLTSH